MDTHKESSDGGDLDEGEDALRTGVKTKVLCYTAGSVVNFGHEECAPTFLTSFLK